MLQGVKVVTRTPRTSLSPDAIKLIVRVLADVVKALDGIDVSRMKEKVIAALMDATVDVERIINACTEEP